MIGPANPVATLVLAATIDQVTTAKPYAQRRLTRSRRRPKGDSLTCPNGKIPSSDLISN
jgi:hypothetical protein